MKDNPPFSFIENEYQEHKVFIQGNSEDTTVNKNFSIRENYIENYYGVSPYFEGVSTGSYVFLLNDFIPVKNMVRSYSSINSITGSSDYLNFNLSSSNLGCVITYGTINSVIGYILFYISKEDVSCRYFYVIRAYIISIYPSVYSYNIFFWKWFYPEIFNKRNL